MTSETTLAYQIYVTPILAIAGNDVPPGQSRSTWSPISATLITGRHDAVLVDPLMTIEQGMAVADWVLTTGKNLTTVYVTHGHGDHWFGLGAVRERFPGVRAVATPAVIRGMRKWSAPEVLQTFWQSRFPGQIPDDNPVADPLDGPSFELEGHQMVAVNVGHSDTDDTTVLHVPDMWLVVAGDVAYLQRRASVPGGIRLSRPPGLARGPRHHRGTRPARRRSRTQTLRQRRQPAHHRSNPPIHQRLRPARQGNHDGRGTLAESSY